MSCGFFLYETLLHTVQKVGFFCSSLQCWLICSVAASECKKWVEDLFLFCFS